jgi:alpha-N-arabinofuranosidase
MTYTNPILPGFYPDPSLCRVGQDYYLTNSSFAWFPGMPIFHSRDLVGWEQIGHILDRDSQLPLRNPDRQTWQGLWAPTLRYHNGRFYCTNVNQGSRGKTAFLVWADDPAGPWSEPIRLEGGGWDNSLWIEPDGTAYYHRAGGPGGIVQCELDLETGRPLGQEKLIFPGTGAGGLEAPHLYHFGDWYYLVVAEGGTHWGHMVSIARSRSPWGPFEPSPHGPLLTHRHVEMNNPIKATGHGDLFQAHDGSWWLVCLGMRDFGWICFGSAHLGRETYLAPVSWGDDGWPIVNQGRDLEVHMDISTSGQQTPPPQPQPVRDAFDSPALSMEWNFYRNPLPGTWSLEDPTGCLRLLGRGTDLADPQASMVARRQQHAFCTASCVLKAEAETAPEAGLCAFLDETHHCEIFVRTGPAGREVVVRRQVDSLLAEVARAPLPAEKDVELFIQAQPRWYTLGFACDGQRQELARAETKHLSVEIGWSFTGAYFGLFALSGDSVPSGKARFEWFDYIPEPDQTWIPTMERL